MNAFLHGFVYAAHGIIYTVRTQRNMRIHLAITAVVVLAGIYFHISALEWAVIAVTTGLVLGTEMTNTVVEMAVDLLTQRYHPMAKAAKDVGAGAVLITAIAAVFVGIAIFGPRLVALFRL
jgi:diacylglycerol kinase